MNRPFWLINFLLLLLFIVAIGFVFISRQKIPTRTSLIPQEVRVTKKPVQKIDLTKIYSNDLFNTYKEPLPPPKPQEITAMPKPPIPKPVKVPLPQPPKFLEPLQITLKGIVIVSEENQNIAIIEDSKTKSSKNYKVGEKIEDAQLIRILRNKIIFIRSNGQQETVYVNPYDAEIDQLNFLRNDWQTIVQKKEENYYLVDSTTFTEVVQNIAQFIDIFNLTTVYQNGQSIGCRVGTLPSKSLGLAMGLQKGDIITKINNIFATTTENRFAIYEQIVKMHYGDIIKVEIKRQQDFIELTYELKSLKTPAQVRPQEILSGKSPIEIQQEKIKLLKEREKFAPTYSELEKKEKENLIMHGKRKNQNVLTNKYGETLGTK